MGVIRNRKSVPERSKTDSKSVELAAGAAQVRSYSTRKTPPQVIDYKQCETLRMLEKGRMK